jgi:transcriptional regulator of acetoin/glycerol metabolism
VIERAIVLCPDGESIGTTHLPEEFHPSSISHPEGERDIRFSRRQSEAQAIMQALEEAGGNRREAARKLGIHKSTLYRKIRAMGLEPPQHDGRYRRDS